MNHVPVTIITGFLGSGKTTLLNHVLTGNHGKKIAVIENEFGEIGVDNELVIGAEEELFEMNNGCICCTIRGDLIRVLSGLSKRKQQLDRIIIETTGLANPGPVAQTFFADNDIRQRYRIDSIVTMVDAAHIQLHLHSNNECRQQIAFADVIIVNKTDLVAAGEITALIPEIRKMNAMATIHQVQQAAIDINKVLGLETFSLDKMLELDPHFTDHHHHHHHHYHDIEEISSVGMEDTRPVNVQLFQQWMELLLQTQGTDIFRSKGIVNVAGRNERYVFQGVHMLFDVSVNGHWRPQQQRKTQIVFIGRNLNREQLQAGFENCLLNEEMSLTIH